MVVALGALDLHAHEDPRDLAGHLHGLGLIGQGEADGPVLVVPAGRRDHFRGDLVPRLVGLELLGQPVLEHVEPDPDGFSLVAWNLTTSRQYLAQFRAQSGLLSRLSISRARLSCERSRTNAMNCSGVGGLPIRSKYIRRTNSTSVVIGAGSTLGSFLTSGSARPGGRAPPRSSSEA